MRNKADQQKKPYMVLIDKADAREVAGMKNPGKDEIIYLTDLQAEHPERIGHIAPKKGK
jgi:hypothetical protein